MRLRVELTKLTVDSYTTSINKSRLVDALLRFEFVERAIEQRHCFTAASF